MAKRNKVDSKSDEETEINPASTYGQSKLTQLFQKMHKSQNHTDQLI